MPSLRYVTAAFLLLIPCGASRAQAQPAASELLGPWADAQQRSTVGLKAISFIESALLVMDSPFGTRRLETESALTAEPGAGAAMHRTLRSAHSNGEPVPRERWDHVARHRSEVLGLPIERLVEATTLSGRVVRHLRPAGSVIRDVVDDVPAWRFDLVPRQDDAAIDRVTVWMARNGRRLLQTRAVLHPPKADGPVVVLTRFVRHEGLDVPVHRRLDGTFQLKRRMRTFTTLLTYEADYSDFRFDFGS